MNERDHLADDIARLEIPALDPQWSKRVLARAKLELPATGAPRPRPWGAVIAERGDHQRPHFRLLVMRAAVPALLALAALVQTVGSASAAARIYGKSEPSRLH
jgi:hypothetical protein